MKAVWKLGVLFYSLSMIVAHADTLRCNGKIVETGMTQVDVMVKCGNPALKEHISIRDTGSTVINRPVTLPSTSVSVNGSTTIGDGDVKRRYHNRTVENVERWTYNFGSGRLLKMLTFTGGTLTAIDDGARVE